MAMEAQAGALTPDDLTFEQISDAAYDRLVSFRLAWDALGEPGAPGRRAARLAICEAIEKQRGAR